MTSQNEDRIASPFFTPSTPRVLRPVSTPGGTFVRLEKKEVDKENKANIFGTTGNLVNAIVGAGIVGIPFALKQSGLVAGVFMVILCAALTDKSLRLLIETAKHINAPSYEVLSEAAFGKFGFYFISMSMFVMAYGGMISYLMIIKDTLPILLGVDADNLPDRRAILVVSSFLIVFPLSCQRDMADLAKTSTVSVIFDCILVVIIATHAPVSETVHDFESAKNLLESSIIRPKTFFIGLGVLSFAFVCQHSGFIIAGSLKNPTKKRWSTVTFFTLIICATLATTIGVSGYIGFGEQTSGNILNSFISPETEKIANVARALLCTTMFFVYPMESFVARHVFIVTFFQGRRAHEGDDHAVLARVDRRIGLTLFLYLSALLPAILFEDLGPVLAFTGIVGGSSLSYIGPGLTYLAIHGETILKMIDESWGNKRGKSNNSKDIEEAANSNKNSSTNDSFKTLVFNSFTWYIFLMPVWCALCEIGDKYLKSYQEKEAMKSPHTNRLGKMINPNNLIKPHKYRLNSHNKIDVEIDTEIRPLVKPLIRHKSFTGTYQIYSNEKDFIPPYGTTDGMKPKLFSKKEIARATVEKNRVELAEEKKMTKDYETETEDEMDDTSPTWTDFAIAVGFVMFGNIALCAGLVSIYTDGSDI